MLRRARSAQAGADRRARRASGVRRRAGRHRSGKCVSRGSSATSASSSTNRGMPVVDRLTFQSTLPDVLFGGDAAFGPKNIIWAVAHGHDAAISIDLLCQGEDVRKRARAAASISSRRRWASTSGATTTRSPTTSAFACRSRICASRCKDIKVEVELGFDPKLAFAEAQRCLNCDVQTVFTDKLCIECDACVDICPMDCINFTDNGEEPRTAPASARAGNEPDPGHVRLGPLEDRAHHGQGRRLVPALRTVRGALPDRRLGHAEVSARTWRKPARHAATRRKPPAPPRLDDGSQRCEGTPATRGYPWEGIRWAAYAPSPRPPCRLSPNCSQRFRQSSSPTSTARAPLPPTRCSRKPILRMGVPVSPRKSFHPTSRVCPPGTRCACRKPAISAGAAASI